MKSLAAFVLIVGVLFLQGCASEPAKLYDGEELPPEQTTVIELNDDYNILALDEWVFVSVDRFFWGAKWASVPVEGGMIQPGMHRLAVLRRQGEVCDGPLSGTPVDLLIWPFMATCIAITETHCATFEFTAEAGHTYEVSAGDDKTVLLLDNINKAVMSRVSRIYIGEATKEEFVESCLRAHNDSVNYYRHKTANGAYWTTTAERAVATLPPPSEAPGSGAVPFDGEWFARNESWLVTLRISHQDVGVRIKCDEASVPYAQSLSANGTIDKDGRISIRIKDLFAHTIYLRGTFPKLEIINTTSYCRDRDLEFQRVGAG